MIAPIFATCPNLFQEGFHKMLIPQVMILSLQSRYRSEPFLYFTPICGGGTIRPTRLAFIPSTDIRLFLVPLGDCPIAVQGSQVVTCRADHWYQNQQHFLRTQRSKTKLEPKLHQCKLKTLTLNSKRLFFPSIQNSRSCWNTLTYYTYYICF